MRSAAWTLSLALSRTFASEAFTSGHLPSCLAWLLSSPSSQIQGSPSRRTGPHLLGVRCPREQVGEVTSPFSQQPPAWPSCCLVDADFPAGVGGGGEEARAGISMWHRGTQPGRAHPVSPSLKDTSSPGGHLAWGPESPQNTSATAQPPACKDGGAPRPTPPLPHRCACPSAHSR